MGLEIKDVPDGSIVLCYATPEMKKKDLAMAAICYFTNSDYFHAQIICKNEVFEAGISKTYGIGTQKAPNIGGQVWAPKIPLTKEQSDEMYDWLSDNLGKSYNIGLAIFLPLIYATKWFWKKINWYPFKHLLFGYICSGLVDKAWKYNVRDLIKDEEEGYTTPGALYEAIKNDFIFLNKE